MSDKYILDSGGDPIPEDNLISWAEWFEASDRSIARDEIGGVRVSTVFLGLDHSFGDGAPLLFETMIFGGQHDGYQERYSTRTQAAAGQEAALALVRSGIQ